MILYWSSSFAPDGTGAGLFRVRVGTSAKGLLVGRPEKLLEAPFMNLTQCRSWDLAPDGRVLIVEEMDVEARRAVVGRLLGDRISVDQGGLPALLAETGKGP